MLNGYNQLCPGLLSINNSRQEKGLVRCMSDVLQKQGFPTVITVADLKKPLMVEAVMQHIDKLVKPGKSIDAEMLVEWFNQQDGEQI